MKKNIVLTLLFALLSSLAAFGQSDFPNNPLSVPTSPQAEAFKRFGDIAVNPSTGIPDISIPLFEINHHGYQLPLSLKYSPTPFRPGYNYDVFGRGWALSVSSCISRSIECMPDETTDFKLDTKRFNELYRFFTPENLETLNLKYDVFSALLPDGSSFEFVIRKNNENVLEYVVSNGREVKISYTTSGGDIVAFTVIDEHGIIYSFTGADTLFRGAGSTFTPYSSAYVSWQLTSIRLPNTVEPITFDYDKNIRSNYGRAQVEQEARFHYKGGEANVNNYDVAVRNVSQQYSYQMKLLTSITYASTTIDIDYQDGSNSAYFNYAKAINIKDNGSLILEIQLAQHQDSFSFPGNVFPYSHLDSVAIGSNTNLSEIYQCKYAGSFTGFQGTDHWGYLNYYPDANSIALLNLFVGFDVSNASLNNACVVDAPRNAKDLSPLDKVRLSREPIDTRQPASASAHRILNKLIYPTGGYTQFVFENHQFLSFTDVNGDYIHDEKQRMRTKAAGFRIREIIDYTADGVRSGTKHYCYGKTDYEAIGYVGGRYTHTGVGEPTLDPTIQTYMRHCSSTPIGMSMPNMVLGLDPNGKYRSFNYNPFTSYDPTTSTGPIPEWEWECSFSVFNFRKLLNNRPAVVYPEVTVYYLKKDETTHNPENCNGKTVYKYDIYVPTPNMESPWLNDSAFFEKPYYVGSLLTYRGQAFRYNLLKERRDYRSDGQDYKLVQRETLRWTPNSIPVSGWEYSNRFGTSFIPLNASLGNLYVGVNQLIGNSSLDHREVTTYGESGNGVSAMESYSYAFGNVIKNRNLYTKRISRQTSWTRPELSTSTIMPDIVRKMAEKNMIAHVLTEVGSNRRGYKQEFDEFSIGDGDTLILPARFYDMEGKNWRLHTEILSYTSNGNPRETINKDGLHTVYLWGYGDRYLIAEIKNATLAQTETAVVSVFGMSSVALANAVVPDTNKLNELRNQSSLAEAYVVTYTHQPLIGLLSSTDPAGLTTTYEYDELGRLLRMKDSAGKVIEEYEYNYAH